MVEKQSNGRRPTVSTHIHHPHHNQLKMQSVTPVASDEEVRTLSHYDAVAAGIERDAIRCTIWCLLVWWLFVILVVLVLALRLF